MMGCLVDGWIDFYKGDSISCRYRIIPSIIVVPVIRTDTLSIMSEWAAIPTPRPLYSIICQREGSDFSRLAISSTHMISADNLALG
jgi:hypothetical protein